VYCNTSENFHRPVFILLLLYIFYTVNDIRSIHTVIDPSPGMLTGDELRRSGLEEQKCPIDDLPGSEMEKSGSLHDVIL
jgi:hypothetical protein